VTALVPFLVMGAALLWLLWVLRDVPQMFRDDKAEREHWTDDLR
jgi:hypothetical protein